MKAISLETEEATLCELAEMARKGPVFITQADKVRYVLLAVDDADVEAYLLGSNPSFVAYLESCRQRARSEGAKSLAEVRAGK